jgi:CheY-like chemotaxis protein
MFTNGLEAKSKNDDARTFNRVLVVDDNTDTLALTRHQLRDRFVLETASDAESALDALRNGRFDALVLDINLGGGHDGIDVLHALRELDAYQHVPVIALTAYAMPEDRDRFLEAGFDAYLSKPFTKQEITDAIDRLLALRSVA